MGGAKKWHFGAEDSFAVLFLSNYILGPITGKNLGILTHNLVSLYSLRIGPFLGPFLGKFEKIPTGPIFEISFWNFKLKLLGAFSCTCPVFSFLPQFFPKKCFFGKKTFLGSKMILDMYKVYFFLKLVVFGIEWNSSL